MKSRQSIDEYINTITDTLIFTMERYNENDVSLDAARTYFWCTIDAYDHFGYERLSLFEEYAKILQLTLY